MNLSAIGCLNFNNEPGRRGGAHGRGAGEPFFPLRGEGPGENSDLLGPECSPRIRRDHESPRFGRAGRYQPGTQ